jgi:hypothetical protein
MTVWLVVAALLAVDPAGGPAAPAPAPGVRFLKGQLHLHSNRSGDSDTPPDDVVRWYGAHGYDFIVFTDHNRITAPPSTPSMLVIPGVELTQNSNRCTPAPLPGRKCLLHVNALFVRASARRLPPRRRHRRRGQEGLDATDPRRGALTGEPSPPRARS